MKRPYIAILCLLLTHGVSAQGNSAYLVNTLKQVELMTQHQENEQALALLESVTVSRNSDKAQLARWLGALYWQQGRHQDAIHSLKQALATQALLSAQTREVQRMLADLYLLEQDYQTSLNYYYPLTQHERDSSERQQLWQRIAYAHYQQGEWQATIDSAQHSLDEHPKTPGKVLQLRLGGELNLKRWQSAIDTLNQLVELQPQQAKWWRKLSSVYLAQGDHRGAMNTLSLAKLIQVELEPSDLSLLARLYAQQGLPELAAKQLVDQDDGSLQRLVQLANYWQWAKEWDKAQQVWIEIASEEPEYYWQVAQLQLLEKEYQAALVSLGKIPKPSAKIMLTEAQIYSKLEQWPQATEAAKRAMQLEPSKEAKRWLDFLTHHQSQH
ncbi:tetratricopeptide repeat protein [Vibrio sp. JPW-9-11-11]|uniref:tetratricopeptide repeat protein n=1 Tax=Vibrio sp. JPW-9-11-11 TaxID=1416532 RepID=UPI0015933263|nr:tetratricopeptide repeat protein [Vibrio sp. JPW-9-11-11]NVD06733.1 tetratricopeptide repeat protein [Vibrio sp. JPW-9-11-11]